MKINLPRALSRSRRPLSAVLADAVARQTNGLRRLQALGEQLQQPEDLQLPLPLDEDEMRDEVPPPTFVRPDEVAVAALLGRALDQDRDAVAKLPMSDAVTIIQVPSPDFVDLTVRILRRHVVGTDSFVSDGDGLALSNTGIAASGSVAVFARDGSAKNKLADAGNAEFASAVQRRFAVIGVAADPERALPRDLVRMAEQRIVLPPLDAAIISIVIKAITGRRPARLNPDVGRNTKLQDLSVAIRADIGPARCVERLRRLLVDRNDASTPLLTELSGLGEAREWGLNLVHDLQAYMAGTLPWRALDGAVLCSSPPGCGKTLFARSLAKTAGVHFVATSYSEWQSHKEGHLGNLLAAMRATFADALAHRPAIIFIDEIDSIPARGKTNRNDDWWTAVVNALLELLDGFSRREGVVVIAACNHPDRLDPALVRSGRLDKHIRIPPPDTPALAGILRAHLGDDLKGVDLLPAAVAARGGTGADVERWCRTARRAARIGERALTLEDVITAIRGGAADLPPAVRRRVAYHEAGHVIAAQTLGMAKPVSVSINPSGGVTETTPTELSAQTREYVERLLMCRLAGRAAEQLVYGNVTAGAGGSARSDLSAATQLAIRLETSFGLGELGPVWAGDEPDQRDLLMFADLRRSVRQTLEKAHDAAKELLAHNRPALDRLAEELLARGYLDAGEIDAILALTPTLAAAGAPGPRDNTVPIVPIVPAVEEMSRPEQDTPAAGPEAAPCD